MTLRKQRGIRLRGYDYSQEGRYFVTFNIHRKAHALGKVKDGSIKLSSIGRIVEKDWLAIPSHFEGVATDEFSILPNHFHGIIIINRPESRQTTGVSFARFGKPTPGSLSVIISAFKAGVTWKARQAKLWGTAPLWPRISLRF